MKTLKKYTTHNEEKNKRTKSGPETTKKIDLVDKDIAQF